jgi:hypothetical protein
MRMSFGRSGVIGAIMSGVAPALLLVMSIAPSRADGSACADVIQYCVSQGDCQCVYEWAQSACNCNENNLTNFSCSCEEEGDCVWNFSC